MRVRLIFGGAQRAGGREAREGEAPAEPLWVASQWLGGSLARLALPPRKLIKALDVQHDIRNARRIVALRDIRSAAAVDGVAPSPGLNNGQL